MNEPLRVGIIGVGGFGEYRRRQLRKAKVFKLVACFDRDAPALAAACKEENAAPCSSVEELLATPGLEALVISTGADSHAELGIRGMNAGLHVFIEKPLCCSPAEVAKLLETQRLTGRIAATGHNDVQSDSIYRLARDTMQSGRLGTIVSYEENTSHSGGLEILPGAWRGLKENNPGGMLFQCGVHALHGLNFLFGAVDSVQAMMRYDAHPGTETADAANVLLRHTSGVLGTLNCYHVTPYCHELRIFGTKAALFFDTHHKKAWIQERKRGEAEPRVALDLPAPLPNADCSNLVHWYGACRGRGAAQPSLEDGIAAVTPVFAAELSAKEGRAVALNALMRESVQHA